jgi:hypothetical protein
MGGKHVGLAYVDLKFVTTPRSTLAFIPMSMMAIKHVSGSDVFASWLTAMKTMTTRQLSNLLGNPQR